MNWDLASPRKLAWAFTRPPHLLAEVESYILSVLWPEA